MRLIFEVARTLQFAVLELISCACVCVSVSMHAIVILIILTGMSCIEFQQFRTTGGPLGTPSISRVLRLHCKGKKFHPPNISFYCCKFQALWVPGSQTEIAVVADSFVKVS